MSCNVVAPKSVKTPVTGGEILPSSALSPSRSVDSQLHNLSVTVNTPVSQCIVYVLTCLSVVRTHLSVCDSQHTCQPDCACFGMTRVDTKLW